MDGEPDGNSLQPLEDPAWVLAELDAAQHRYQDAALAASTRRAYASDLRRFARWCTNLTSDAYPATPDTIARYVTHLAQTGRKVATIDRPLAAIGYLHTYGPAVLPEDPTVSPTVTRTMRGIRRTHGSPPDTKRALSAADVLAMTDGLDLERPAGLRDRAIILFGFASGMRRSELVTLERRDLTDDPDGLRVLLREAKGDAERVGQHIGVAFGPSPTLCPVRALRAWLEVSPYPHGPVVGPIDRHGNIRDRGLTGQAIADILKKHARSANLVRDSSSRHLWDGIEPPTPEGGQQLGP